MKCPKCKSEVEFGNDFCPRCGADLKEVNANEIMYRVLAFSPSLIDKYLSPEERAKLEALAKK